MLRSLVSSAVATFCAAMFILVGGRLFALVVHANRNSELIGRLYRHSDFWVKPFFGVFGLSNEAVNGGGTFEPASLIALSVYLIGGMLAIAIINSGSVMHTYRGDYQG